MWTKNRYKDCVLCNSKRINNIKFCSDCVRIHNYVRMYGVNSTLIVLKALNNIYNAPSAPAYNNT
jgi:acetate kinase